MPRDAPPWPCRSDLALAPALALVAPLVLLVSGSPGFPGSPEIAALAFICLAPLALVSARARRAFDRPWLTPLALGLTAAVIAWILYAGWLDAAWYVIDDHEIFTLLHGKSRLGPGEALTAWLSHYEVLGVADNSLARYRPVYFALRFAGLALFGDQVAPWNLTNILAFFAALWLILATLTRLFGPAMGLVSLLAALTAPFWPGVLFTNLQQESYALLGLSLFLFGFARALDPAPGQRPLAGALSLAIGAALAMGVKENFLFLLPFLAWAAWILRREHKASPRILAAPLTALGLGVAQALVLTALLFRQGSDMYAQAVTGSSRAALILPGLAQFAAELPLEWFAPALVPILILGQLFRRAGRWPGYLRDARTCLLCALAAGLIYCSQYVFYNGRIGLDAVRYDFPALLCPLAAWLGLARLAARAARAWGWRPARRLVPALILGLLAAYAAGAGFAAWREDQRLAVEKTRAFDARIRAVAIFARAEPARPLVLYARNPDSIEPVWSVLVHLRLRLGVANPIYLDYRPGGTAPDEARYRNQDSELARMSRDGSAYLAPLGELDTAAEPFGLGLDGPPQPGSKSLGRIWPLP